MTTTEITTDATPTPDFEAVAKAYGIKAPVQRGILKAMIDHPYVTLIKLPQQNVALVGKAHGTLTKAISELVNKRSLPITKERPIDSGGTQYTRYYLNKAEVARHLGLDK